MPVILLQPELPSTNLPFLFAAFAVSWAAFFIYAFFVTRRQQELRREIREMRLGLERSESEGGA